MTEELQIDCKCIDAKSLADLKLALVTAKDTYKDIATILTRGELHKTSDETKNILEQAKKFDMLLHELSKIPPC